MKRVTTAIRPVIAVGIGLAAASAIALPSAPGSLAVRDLRLAAHAVSAPEAGTYWHTRTLSKRTTPWQLGSGANRYWVEEQEILETWNSADGRSWFGLRQLGTWPKGAADEKAWRRDGSPAKWSRTADGSTVELSTAPEKGKVRLMKGTATFLLAGQRLSWEEVQQLSVDPNGLKAWINKAGRVSKVPEDRLNAFIRGSLPDLMYNLPARKESRAAAYQALLTMPGVRSEGQVKDAMGRVGAGLSIDEGATRQKDNTISSRVELIVDTNQMLLLARNRTTALNGKTFPNKSYTETMLQVGWTDTAPAVPALP